MALDHGWIVSMSGIRARGDESLARIVTGGFAGEEFCYSPNQVQCTAGDV